MLKQKGKKEKLLKMETTKLSSTNSWKLSNGFHKNKCHLHSTHNFKSVALSTILIVFIIFGHFQSGE